MPQVLDEDGSITDPFIRNYLDLLCFLLSGLPSDGTIAAEVAFMFNVRGGSCAATFPRDGALARLTASEQKA